MRNLTIRLFFISGFLLLSYASLFAQCPDTQPVVIGPDVVRAGQTVTYMTYAIPGHSYSWSLSGGGAISGSSTNNQVTVAWGANPTSATLSVSETNSAVPGCTPVVAQRTITLQPLLHAYFYYQFDPTGGCYYNIVNFTADPNVSVHPNDPSVTYTWNFNDGTGNHTGAASQTYTFPVTGAYTPPHTFPVTLTIQNPGGQVDSITDYVYVDPDKFKPQAQISAVTFPTPNCLYGQVNFSGAGSLPKPASNPDPNIKIKYCDWYVDGVLFFHSGDGVTVPCPMTANYTFTAPGTYNITLTVTNTINCTNTISTPVVVGNTVPLAAFIYNQACVNEATSFTDQSLANTGTITDWYWNWGDGSGTEHYSIPGNPPPSPVTHVFNDLLPHNVTLRVVNTNGCENTTIQIPVQAAPSPKADFAYPTTICEGDIVQFNNMSSPQSGSPIATYQWNFDDPMSASNTSTDPNPQHMFSGAGSFHVTLTVTNQNGCANTKTLTTNPVVVSPHPFIDYTFTLGTIPYQVHFFDTINAAQNVGNNLYWEFGDGTNTYGGDPTHIFPGAGAFTVRVTATDMATGCSNYIEHTIAVGAPPSAFFTANPPQQCQNQPVVFVPGPPGGMINTEDWEFGDGGTAHFVFPATPASPTHTYAAPGPYHVVRVLNAGTVMESQFDLWITVYPAPTAQFTWFSDPAHLHQWKACDGQDVYFVDESYSNSTPTGTIYQWAWNFDDPLSGAANTSNLQNPQHTFMSGKASYNVTLVVTDNIHDCQSSPDIRPVPINTPIPVEFSYNNNVCIDNTVNFTTDPIALPPAAYTWLWDFGDGTTLTTPGSVSHLYAAVQDYTVTLTLTDTLGCTKSKQHVVSIIPKPIANFTFTTPTCFGAAIQFTDLSNVPLPYNDIIVGWDWDFGDGSTHSTVQNPSHIYTTFAPGGYNVILTVTTNRGCTNTKTLNVQQIASPAAEFEVTGGTFSCIAPQNVHFSDLTQTNGGGNLMTWAWDFGDPSSGSNNFSPAQNPSHIFNVAGPYLVTLIVKNTNGCTDTIAHTITINDLPAPDFTFTTPCLGNNTLFTDVTVPNATGILSWAWDFGDGGTSPLQNPQHQFATAGPHTVTLVVVNSNGCTNTITKTVTVNPKPIVDFISTSPFCQHAQVTFTSQSYVPAGFTSFINNWAWDFGDGNFGTGPVVVHTYTDNSISHTVKLIATTTDGCTDSISRVVTGIPAPVADFTYLGVGCLNQSLSFVDNSQTNGGGTITQWSWNFADPGSGSSNTSTLQNPTHSFTSAGPHLVTLIVTNVNGCTATKQINVDIFDKPVADFTATNSCLNNLTVFTDASTTPTGTIVTWAWDFGDGGTSPLQNPSYMFSTAGIHYVTLTVTNSNGCSHQVQKPVEVYPKPITSFSFSSPTCAGNTVTFTDMSTTGHGYVYRRYWDFGDGNLLNTFSNTVTHQYNLGGPYNVTLTVTTSDSCTGVKTIPVPIQFAPMADFTVSNSPCVLSPMQFNDISQQNGGGNITQWNWNFGDPGSGAQNTSPQQNPVHNFSAAGTFWVFLTVSNADGCTSKDSMQVTINANPVADFTATNACQGNATTFTDNSIPGAGTIVSWYWTFGDGGNSTAQNPTYTYAVGGTWNVTLTVTTSNGCTKSVTKPVNVWPRPIVTFSYTSPTCAGSSVTFTDISTTSHGYVTNRVWDFGDGNVSAPTTSPTITHTYTGGGTYQVKLTITTSDNCTDFTIIPVYIQYNPISGFQWSAVTCLMQPVQFTDISQENGGGQITQWFWTFGDPGSGSNNTSTQQNPTHSFTAAGNYMVHLKVTNASGCYKDSSAQITIEANPTANFSATTVCKGSPTVFTDNSTGGGTIVTWAWDFGDGGTANVQNPTYTFANSGTFNVTLLVTTQAGCHNTVVKTVEVYGEPTPQFSFSSPTCSSDSVQFTDLSTTAHGIINKWEWTFGDGQTATILAGGNPNVKHKYANGGTYNVTLKIYTNDNCEKEITIPVPVEYKPAASWSNDLGACAQKSTQFHDLSQANGGTPIVSWLWTFGDPASGANNTSTMQNPTHDFTAGGVSYSVKLKVTNATGCYDTLTKSVAVNVAPVANFTFDTACIASPTQFHDGSTSASGTVNAWQWDFGDPSSGSNNQSTLQNPTHNYAAPGNYMVRLTITNSNNCVKDTLKQVSVSPKPQALFQYEAACAQDSTTFTDLSIAPLSQIVAWSWDFGDGGTATIQNPKHKYTSSGTFNVKEVVTNLSGCKDSVTIAVMVHPKPVAAYQYTSKFCPGGQVTFQDMSTASGATITDHLWIFEAGGTSTVPNPVYNFPVTDTTYAVTLIVTDTYGCRDTIVDSVRVKPKFDFTFTNDTVCFGYPMHFHPVNLATGDSLYSPKWEFGDPNSGPANKSTLYNTTHVFTAPGLYYVKLKVFNSDNCIDSVFRTVQVYSLPKPAFTYTAPQCDSIIHFIDTTSNFGTGTIASWEWRFGDGSPPLIIPAPGPGDTSHIYSTPGDYMVTLIVTNTRGCVDSITQKATRLPCIKANYIYPDTLRCMNYMITFQDTSIPTNRIKQWKWSWGDGTPDTTYGTYTRFVKHKFTSPGTYNVKLRVKAIVNSVNVFDSLTQPVIIHPTPTTLFSNINVCLHQPALFRDTSLTNGEAVSAWKWNFGEPTSGVKDTSTFKNPAHTYATRDTFDVKLVTMNKYGCKDSLTKPIRIYGLPLARFNYTAACTGDPTLFRDSSSVADTAVGFWHWNFGDPSSPRDTSLLKDPSYKYKTAGNYLLRLIVKDYFGCKDTVDSTITVHITPVAAFTLINGYEGTPGKVKLNNQSSGASAYSWDFGNGKTSNDTNPVASFTEDGTYTIKLISTNTFGCTDTTYYEYKILFRGLFVPNAFAPTSGNMAVRLFKPVGINLKTYHVQVFDTWGHLMWESTKLDSNGAPLDGWDGTNNGNVMPQGNYFWKINATFIDDSPWTGSETGVKGGGGTMGSVILLK